jgi:hypothetical protein
MRPAASLGGFKPACGLGFHRADIFNFPSKLAPRPGLSRGCDPPPLARWGRSGALPDHRPFHHPLCGGWSPSRRFAGEVEAGALLGHLERRGKIFGEKIWRLGGGVF